MAINIFQGNKAPKNKPKGVSTNNTKNRSSLTPAGSVSSKEGTTAVRSNGILGKIGGLVKNVLPTVSKFLPGPLGAVAKMASGIFNDPEWWQTIPGPALTSNLPLQAVKNQIGNVETIRNRPAMLQFSVIEPDETFVFVKDMFMAIDANMATQYLLPEVRKVVNAIPLQTANEYAKALEAGAMLYAYWRCLLKYDFMIKHGQPYMPNIADGAFPIFNVANAATLEALIRRSEEALRAHVRLPHTLCEYLAWRYGRVYRTNPGAKSAIAIYDLFPLAASIDRISAVLDGILTYLSSTPELQQANTDLFNCYYDHDLAVDIADDTQYRYDPKEFCLRTNLDTESDEVFASRFDSRPDIVILDSELDNPTLFMASTVSTTTVGGGTGKPLFPVKHAVGFSYCSYASVLTRGSIRMGSTLWYMTDLRSRLVSFSDTTFTGSAVTGLKNSYTAFNELLAIITVAKACDYYNMDLMVQSATSATANGTEWSDITTLSIDAGFVTEEVMRAENLYAFANLITTKHKNSLTYKAAEKLVARDTADFIASAGVSAV